MVKLFWTCAICKDKNVETGSYRANLGYSYAIAPEKNVCVKCCNDGFEGWDDDKPIWKETK